MNTSRKFSLLGILLAAIVAWLWWTTDRTTVTLETLITEAASRQLERPVNVKIDLRNADEDWVFICGTITEADGTELSIEISEAETAYESDDFCALAKVEKPSKLTEFDFGSTDMPAVDWLERYDLNPDILSPDRP